MPSGENHTHNAWPASVDITRLCDVMEIAIVVVDAGGNVKAVNNQAERLFGYTKDELVGQSVELLVPPRYRATHERLRAGFMVGMRAHRNAAGFEMKALCKDGRELDVQIGLTACSSENGDVVTAAIRDLTAIKRDQREALESRRALGTLISNLPGMVYRCRNDYDWSMEYVNEACQALTGYPASDLTGRKIDYADLIHPDDRARVWDEVQARIAKKQPFSLTYRIITAGGKQKWVWEQGCGVHDAIGKVFVLEGFITDITDHVVVEQALRESESRLAEAQRVAHVGHWDWDIVADTVFWSDETYRIFGLEPREFGVTYEAFLARVHQDDRAGVDRSVDRALKDREPHVIDHRIVLPDGTVRMVHERAEVTFDADGTPVRMLGTVLDVTERHRADEDYRELLESAPDAVVIVAPDGRIVVANAQAESLFGYKREELLQAPVEMLMPERFRLEHPQHREAFLRNPTFRPVGDRLELTALHKDGKEIPVEISISLVHRDEKLLVTAAIRDITRRKRVQDELRKSERRYHTLADLAPVGIFRTDAAGLCIYVNDFWCRLTGLTPEEAHGSEWTRALHPEDRHRVVREWELAVRQSRPIRLEFRFLPPSGEEVWVYGQAAAETDADGRVLGYVGTLTDTTDMKRADREIIESNERFLQLAENVKQVLWITDWKNRRLLYVNSAYERVFGRSCESIYADRRSWLDLVHPDDRERVAAKFRDAAEAAAAVDTEYRIVRDDGEVRWVNDTAIPVLDDDGRADRIIGIASDITVRKAAEAEVRDSEAKFRQLAENIDEVFWLQDAPSRALLYVSPAYETVFGRSVESLMRDRCSWMQMVHPEDRTAVEESFKDGALLGRPVELEYRIVRDDGEERWLYDRAVPIHDEDGRIVRVAGIAHDITERKQVEKAREELAARLRQSQKMEAVGTLATGVAHDFNNVLTAIIGYLEIARAKAPKGVLAEALDGINRAAEQAVGIAKAMLMFGRKSSTARVPVAIGQVVEDSTQLFRRMMPASIEVKAETVGTDDLWVEADATQIQQVVMNLSVNARDAMPDGGELRLIVRKVDGGAALIVEDTGTGMSEDVRRQVFEPFFTTKTRGQGTGLGMAVVHGIVQDHDGRIDIASQPDRGTRVTITLPRCEPAPTAPQPAALSRGRVDGNGQTVLLAEDHEQVRRIAAQALTSAGFKVLEVGTGVEAMSTFEAAGDGIDVLVIDVDLPGHSGLSCLQQMRSRCAALPVVIITGNPEFALEEELARTLVLLKKPFTLNELLQATCASRRLARTQPVEAC